MENQPPQAISYAWDLVTDRWTWRGEPASFLGGEAGTITTGAHFDAHIPSEQREMRRSAMKAGSDLSHAADGRPYRFVIAYAEAAHAQPIWLDDIGSVTFAMDGQPLLAEGTLRLIDPDELADKRLLSPQPHKFLSDDLNRTRLMEALGARLGRAERTGELSALFMASLNGIEAINSHLGFEIGDELIAEGGRLLRTAMTEQNAIFRYASNTLAIISDLSAVDALAATAASIVARIRDATIQTSAGPIHATVSVGAIAFPQNASSVSEAISHALDALDTARKSSTGFAVYRPEATSERARRREQALTASVVAALEDDRLLLALQPIVEARSGEIAYYEGLLRLRDREGVLHSASEFVADAEKLGFARDMDRRALGLGLDLLARHPRLKLSINVSSLTPGDRGWIATLTAAPELARRLVIEITETAMIHDLDRIAGFVDEVRALGCRVAIDDFGSGYTSFRHLRSLKVDILKIDGMFVSDLARDPQGIVIVKTMIDMAKALNLETVAEWVGDEASRDALREAGATHLQGYFYGRPSLADELEQKGLL